MDGRLPPGSRWPGGFTQFGSRTSLFQRLGCRAALVSGVDTARGSAESGDRSARESFAGTIPVRHGSEGQRRGGDYRPRRAYSGEPAQPRRPGATTLSGGARRGCTHAVHARRGQDGVGGGHRVPPADRARHREPGVALALRHRHRRYREQLRPSRRASETPPSFSNTLPAGFSTTGSPSKGFTRRS